MNLRENPLAQLVLVKVRELVREPEALFWIFVFPVLLALTLGLAFRSKPAEVTPVGVVEGAEAQWLRGALGAEEGFAVVLLGEVEARARLRTGKLALVVIPGEPWTYWYDPSRPESRLARLAVDDALQRAAGRADPRAVTIREMTEKGSRYIDFLIPGLIGMNLMSTGLWGVGYYLVNTRQKNLLKRLIASPMRKSDYLLAQVGGRMIFLGPEVAVLLAVANLAMGVPVRGSLVAVALICLIGGLTFSGIGLLIGARARTIEGVSGLMNVVMLPMWILSGIFFSTSRFPDAMQPLIQALPLTPLIDSLRAVMLEGASLAAVTPALAITAAWGVASFAVALRIFRWK